MRQAMRALLFLLALAWVTLGAVVRHEGGKAVLASTTPHDAYNFSAFRASVAGSADSQDVVSHHVRFLRPVKY